MQKNLLVFLRIKDLAARRNSSGKIYKLNTTKIFFSSKKINHQFRKYK
jgi:hypothetical protein